MQTSGNAIQQCDLVVTENCFLRCRMCHIWKHTRDDEQVSPAEYMEFMASLRGFTGGRTQIQFVGGEPLVKKGIADLVAGAARLGFSTTMTTNGYLLDEDMRKAIARSGLHTLGFSLESLEEERHDSLRGVRGVYRRIMDSLAYFKGTASPGQIFVSTIIMAPNLDELSEIAAWAQREDRIKFIYFQSLMQPFAMPEDERWYLQEECRFLWPDADAAARALDKLIALKKTGCKISNQTAQLEAFKAYFKYPNRFIKKTKCNLGYKSFTVLPSGDAFLCLSLPPIGNIKTERIDQMWFSEKAQSVREQIARCQVNCKLMVNCFFEEEAEHAGAME